MSDRGPGTSWTARRRRRSPCRSSNHHPGPPGPSRSGLDDDLDVAAEQHEESHEAVERESGKSAPRERGDLRLIDLENLGGCSLGQSPALENGADLPRQFRLRERFRRSRVAVPGRGGCAWAGRLLFEPSKGRCGRRYILRAWNYRRSSPLSSGSARANG